jgi:hypothetical protein
MEPDATPLNVALHTLLGGATGAIGLPTTTGKKYAQYAKDRAEQLVTWLHTQVPSWKEFTGPRALYQMARGIEGQTALSNMYEDALRATKGKIPADVSVWIPTDVARVSKLPMAIVRQDPPQSASAFLAGHADEIPVNAHALIDALPTFGKGFRPEKKAAMDALAQATGGLQELQAANREYTYGSGWMAMGKKLFKHGEAFDPIEAQKALRTSGKETFGPRGMQDAYTLMRGPGEKEIDAIKRPLWERALIGAKAGGLAGASLGLPGASIGIGLGGIAGPLMIPKVAYKNIPAAIGPLARTDPLRQAAIQALAQQAEPTTPETERTAPGPTSPPPDAEPEK